MSKLFESSSTSKVQLPKWVNQASKSNYAMAQDIAARPYNPYTGERIAGFNDVQKQGMQGMLDFAGGNVGGAALGDAMGTMRNIANYSPDKIAAGIDTYMNPYIDKVVNNVINDMDRSRQMAVMYGGADATKNQAFGGSRHGVADGLTNSEFIRNAGNMSDQLRSQGWDRAANLAARDIDNSLNSYQLNLSAANNLAGMGQTERNWALQNLGLVNQVGAQQQAMQQALNDWNYQQFLEERDYPLQQLGLLQSALGMSPYGQTQTNTSTPSYMNMITQMAGAAMAGSSGAPRAPGT